MDVKTLQPFHAECQVAGAFFFLPYILESGILDVVKQCALPQSTDIGNQQAALSMLLLKLIGNERLSHIQPYDADRGFGVIGTGALVEAYGGDYRKGVMTICSIYLIGLIIIYFAPNTGGKMVSDEEDEKAMMNAE